MKSIQEILNDETLFPKRKMTITVAMLKRIVVGYISVLNTVFEVMNTDNFPHNMKYIDVYMKLNPYTASALSMLNCLQELKEANPKEAELIDCYVQYIEEKAAKIEEFIKCYRS